MTVTETFTIDVTASIVDTEAESFRSSGGLEAEVTGIAVVRNGQIIQEWHKNEHVRYYKQEPDIGTGTKS